MEHKREARLLPLNCFPGSVFHETIQTALLAYQATGVFPPDLIAIARRVAGEYIEFSKQWVADVMAHPVLGGFHKYWIDHEFAQPIEAYYYDGDFQPGYRAQIKAKLERWFGRYTTLLPSLPFSSVDRSFWVFPKQVSKKAPWFVHKDEFAVYANFDFLTLQENKVTIYDWKTGRREKGEHSVAEQLTTYAAYAISKWGVKPEQIELYSVWVDDGSVQKVECDQAEIERAERRWSAVQRDWSERLKQVNGRAEKLYELFPMTQNSVTCTRCPFRSCPGRSRMPSGLVSANEMEFEDA